MNEAYLLEDDDGNQVFIDPDKGTGSICIYQDITEQPIFTFGTVAEIDRFAEILRAGLAAAK